MTFADVVMECARDSEFVAVFERLTETPSLSAGGINAAIDDASGLREEWCVRFINFVYDFVWTRIQPETWA